MTAHRVLPIVDDCYRRIGVHGDRSCPRLAEVVHCNSCDVLAGTAQRLLERPADEAYVEELTKRLATPLEASRKSDQSFVLFKLSGERLALPTGRVAEVSVVSKGPSRIPHRSNGTFAGLLNLNGQLELCFFLEGLVGRLRSEDKAHSYALVVSHDDQRWVLLVDSVEGVFRTHVEDVIAAPPRSARRKSALVTGLLNRPDGLYGVIDVSKLCANLSEAMQ
jgi:chemotaxis-related protein WspD